MTDGSRFWFGAFVLLVFVTGALSGVVLDRVWLVERGGAAVGRGEPGFGPGPGRRGGGPGPLAIEGQIARLDRQLDLTAAQQAQLREILRRWNARANELQREARREFVETQAALREDIEAILSTDQRVRFRRLPGQAGPGRRGGPPR